MSKLQHVDKQSFASHPSLIAIFAQVEAKEHALADLKLRRKALKADLKSTLKAFKKEWKTVEKQPKATTASAQKSPVKKVETKKSTPKAANPGVAARAAQTAPGKAVKTAPAKATTARKGEKKAG